MTRLLPVYSLCLLTGCASPAPVHPDARIARENADLKEQRNALIEHMQRLQHEIEDRKAAEAWLREALGKTAGGPF